QCAGLEKPPDRLRRVTMLRNDRFERTFLAESGREFGAQAVEMVFGFRFLLAFEFQQFASARNFFGQRFHALRNRLELDRQLSALPSKDFGLRSSRFHFGLESLGLAVSAGHALLSLRELISQIRDRRDGFEHCGTRLFLLLL